MLGWETSQGKARIVTVDRIVKEEGWIHFLLNTRTFLSYALNGSLHKLPLLLQRPLQARGGGSRNQLCWCYFTAFNTTSSKAIGSRMSAGDCSKGLADAGDPVISP
jgi:hypothetical protein